MAMKSSNDFEADIPSHSESESQTQHLTNPAEQTSGVIYLLENLYQKHCGNSKIPMRRKLMWTCSALLFVYYMIGLAYYSTTMEWGFTNTIYFITVSLSGIGYGAFVPATDNARVFTAFYVMFGVVLFYYTISSITRGFFTMNQNKFVDWFSPSNSLEERHSKHIAASVLSILFAFFLGLFYFSLAEPWTASQAFYFVVITMTTIGYGDFVPTTLSTRGFFIFWVFFFSLAYVNTLNNVLDSYKAVSNALKNRSSRLNGRSGADASQYNLEMTPTSTFSVRQPNYSHEENSYILSKLMQSGEVNLDSIEALRQEYKLRPVSTNINDYNNGP